MNYRFPSTVIALAVFLIAAGCRIVHGARAQTAQAAQPSRGASPATRTTIEPAAMVLIKKVDAKMAALKTYRAEWAMLQSDRWNWGTPHAETYRLRARVIGAKPNRLRYEVWQAQATGNTAQIVSVYDGKIHWQQSENSYRATPRTTPPPTTQLRGFYATRDSLASYIAQESQKPRQRLTVRRLAAAKVGTILCDRISLHVVQNAEESQSTISETIYFIGRTDHLIHRLTHETHMKSPRGRMDLTSDAVAQTIVVNAPIPAAKTVFAYVPAKGVTHEEPEPAPPPLLASGTVAPDFAATDKDGNTVQLSDYRGKVVLLDFWASWCPPCIASMPHNQALTKKLQGENLPVVLLAIDNSEEQTAFLKWVNAHREMDAIRFAYVDPKTTRFPIDAYKVTGIPTQYVIDAESNALEQAVRAAAKQK